MKQTCGRGKQKKKKNAVGVGNPLTIEIECLAVEYAQRRTAWWMNIDFVAASGGGSVGSIAVVVARKN